MTLSTSSKTAGTANRRLPPKKMARKTPAAGEEHNPADFERMQFRRMGLVGGLLFVVMLSVLGTCVYLQGCEAENFLDEAERNYLRMLRLDTQRGDVFDRNGEALATSVEVDTVYANPAEVSDPVTAAQELSRILDIDVEPLIRQLTSESHFRYIKRQVTAEEARGVQAAGLQGIQLLREAKRFYPKKELAGQVLGVVGFDSKGQEGLEATYDDVLRGGTLHARYHRDVNGRYAMLEALPPIETRAGHSLQITIDEKVQAIAEQEIERAVLSSLGKSGVVVVMEVSTGDVLAMAHYPRFNPNRYRAQIAADHAARERGEPVVARFRNRAITDQYEPGSTFKIFTIAAALDAGVVGLDDVIDTENGRYRVGRKTISDTHPYRSLDVWGITKYSSNIGVIKIAEMLGRDLHYTYLERFGFGLRTGIDVQGEGRGLLRPPKEWAEITRANIAFGQGVAVTPLQLTAATAAIGNDGVLMQPRLVLAELDSDGRIVRRTVPQPLRRVIDPKVAALTRKAMMGVVEHDGTGHMAWIYDYDVAGKTGTAQKPDTLAGGYAEDRWVASFVGLVPAEAPRLAILVAVDEPQGIYYGGVVAAPAFKVIAEWTLNYLGVPPSYGQRERVRRQPEARRSGEPVPAAEGAYYDYPEGSRPGVDPTEPASAAVPDFTGLPIRDAVRRAHAAYLVADVDGSGVAAGQSVPAGRYQKPWTRVTIYFRPDGPDGELPAEPGDAAASSKEPAP